VFQLVHEVRTQCDMAEARTADGSLAQFAWKALTVYTPSYNGYVTPNWWTLELKITVSHLILFCCYPLLLSFPVTQAPEGHQLANFQKEVDSPKNSCLFA
jgi:hypothetical protein